jgi:hypothetical protein
LASLARVLAQCGWAEIGGRLLRAQGDQGEVIGRTTWVARAPWWLERPEGLTEARCAQVIGAALGGARLGERQRRWLAWLVAVAEAEAGLSDNTGGASDSESVPF